MQIEFLHERSKAQVGQKFDATSATVVSSHSLAPISFGALVVYDEADAFLCKLPEAGKPIAKPLGIALRQNHSESYLPKSSIAVLRKGRVWVEADKVLAAGDGVYLHFDEKGAAKCTGDSKDNMPLKNAIFLDKCDNGLVPLEIDFMGGVL